MKASPDDRSLEERLARLIAATGPIPVAQYMAEANAHYYATRDPFGRAGDFVTAPEISQMFGELVGIFLADLWMRAGNPAGPAYVELGPGRGTLASDALRAMEGAELRPEVHFVETSPMLRAAQRSRFPKASWHEELSSLPADRPLLIVANEFFDALPVRQFISVGGGWHERRVDWRDGRFVPVAGPRIDAAVPPQFRAAPDGTILEASPASAAIMEDLAARVSAQGGAALIVDYGHDRTSPGETLQAVEKHGYADPWERPGERDLTVHVVFEALTIAARRGGCMVKGPVGQGEWLKAMGIEIRAETLSRRSPSRSGEIEAALKRLTAPDQMGTLFRALAVTAPHWPEPAGFQ